MSANATPPALFVAKKKGAVDRFFFALFGRMWYTVVRAGVVDLLEEIQILRQSERGRVILLQDPRTGAKSVRKELQGQYPVYTQLQSLSHPYLPQIREVTLEEDRTVILEEYIEGATLDGISLSQRQLTRLLLELCDVLTFLHGQGILHRDIKPSNLMLAADGYLRLIDFDAAREERPQADQDTRLLGTRGYAPPEQYGFAQTDARADIYALGVTFRQLLGPLARKRRWKKLLRKCTALDPKDRYRSVGQIRRAVWLGRARRWLLRPVLFLILAQQLYYLAIIGYGIATDTEFREVLHGVIFETAWLERTRVFQGLDVDKLKTDRTVGRRYTGDVSRQTARVQAAYPGRGVIYTGYLDEADGALFGVFEVSYSVYTGEYRYERFLGLCAAARDGSVTPLIDPQACQASPERYGPAVRSLYALDVFDTPIF